jgi:hypothetical protein
MSHPGEVVVATLPRARAQVVADLFSLAKPRVVLMVLVTTVVGYYVGLAGAPDYARLLALLIGTSLAAGGTLALNQYWERDVDALMDRTRTRALPEGRLAPLEALLFGSATTAGGLAVLALGAGRLAALVTAVTFVLYVFAYTPLKLRTPLCTLVGAIPVRCRRHGLGGRPRRRRRRRLGAVRHPVPVAAAATLAIARLYQADYARAGRAAAGDRCAGRLDRAADPERLPGAAGGELAPDPDRPGRRRLFRRRAPARRHLRRVRRATGDGALRAPRAPCAAGVAALPAGAAGAAGLRQGMSIVMSDLQERNRWVRRIILTAVAVLVVASFLVGIRW